MKTGSIRRTVLCGLTGTLILTGSVYAERLEQKAERRRAGQRYIVLLLRQHIKHPNPLGNGQLMPLRPEAYWDFLKLQQAEYRQKQRDEYFSYR